MKKMLKTTKENIQAILLIASFATLIATITVGRERERVKDKQSMELKSQLLQNDSILIKSVTETNKRLDGVDRYMVYQNRKNSIMMSKLNNPELIKEVKEMTYWYKLSVETEKKNYQQSELIVSNMNPR